MFPTKHWVAVTNRGNIQFHRHFIFKTKIRNLNIGIPRDGRDFYLLYEIFDLRHKILPIRHQKKLSAATNNKQTRILYRLFRTQQVPF